MALYRVTTDELYHHGIKGQKWYVRRYQNEDGTLTEAGRERYGRKYKGLSNNTINAVKSRAEREYKYRGAVNIASIGGAGALAGLGAGGPVGMAIGAVAGLGVSSAATIAYANKGKRMIENKMIAEEFLEKNIKDPNFWDEEAFDAAERYAKDVTTKRGMQIDDKDSAVTKRVKNDYNDMNDDEFRKKYQTTKEVYRKRVEKYGDPYMNAPLAKMGKALSKKK